MVYQSNPSVLSMMNGSMYAYTAVRQKGSCIEEGRHCPHCSSVHQADAYKQSSTRFSCTSPWNCTSPTALCLQLNNCSRVYVYCMCT